MKNIILLILAFGINYLFPNDLLAQTSWTGAISTDWAAAGNWSSGIPTSLVDAKVGDQIFIRQPIITSNAVCKSLTIGGVTASTLTLNSFSLTVAGNLVVNLGNTLTQNSTLTVNADVINNGTLSCNAIFNIGGNFTNGGTFNSGTSTIILNGSSGQSVSSSTAFNNLTINKTTGVVSTISNINVGGILNFIRGIITTGLNQVIITSTGSVTGASSSTGWVNGKMNKSVSTTATSSNFEIGDANYYTPVSMNFTVVAVGGTVTASTLVPDHPNIATSGLNPNKSVNRYFTLTNNNIVFTSVTVVLNWSLPDNDAGTNPANFRVAIYNGNSWSMPATSSPSNTSITSTLVTSLGDFAIGELSNSATWSGVTSTDWNVGSNWVGNTIPTSITNVTIPSNGVINFPVVSSAVATCNDITISSGASLTVSGQSLKISGAIANSGTFAASTGTIEMNSSSAQTIPSGCFSNKQVNNLIISNTSTSGVILADSVGILNSLSFGNVNNSKLNTGGLLVIKSLSNNTGRIADATNGAVNTGNTISGNVTVERYIPANNMRGYRFVTPSVNTTNSIHANWQEGATSRTNNPHPGYGTHITGSRTDQTNGFDGTITGNQSLYRYDLASNNFVGFANTDVLKLYDTTSYLLYFRGDRTINLDLNVQGSTNTTLRATGTITQGSVVYSNTVDTTNANGGFTLIANPYAAPISWASIYANNSRLTNSYTYFDPKINSGSYVTVTNTGTRSNLSSNATVEIQSGESFFIQANSRTAPILTINETFKSTNNNINIFKATSAPSDFYTSLFINDNLGRRNADGVLSRFDGSFSNRIDGDDADEMDNFNENIALNSGSHHLSIESRATPLTTDTVRIYMSNMKEKNYDLQFNAMNFNSQPGMTAVLVDNFTGVKSNLSFDTTTIVPFSITSNASSSDTDRFYIVFTPTITLPVTLTNFKGLSKNNGIELNWTVSQEINLVRYEIERSSNGNSFSKIGSVNSKGNSTSYQAYTYFDNVPVNGVNYYRLNTVDKNAFTYSQIIVVNTNVLTTSISIYPNPLTGTNFQLKMINIASGKYRVNITDKAGRIVYSDLLTHDISSEIESIHFDRVLSKGLYQISCGDNNIEFIIQ